MAGYLPDSGHARTKSIGSHGLSPVVRLTLRTNTQYRSACETSTTLGLGRTSDCQLGRRQRGAQKIFQPVNTNLSTPSAKGDQHRLERPMGLDQVLYLLAMPVVQQNRIVVSAFNAPT